jgi:hypothetical protein
MMRCFALMGDQYCVSLLQAPESLPSVPVAGNP